MTTPRSRSSSAPWARSAIALALVLALPLLTSCAGSKPSVAVVEAAALPDAPERFKACPQLIKIPIKQMSGAELTRLAARLRVSEAQKSRCVRDFLAWYAGVQRDFGPAPKRTFSGLKLLSLRK